MKMTKEYFNNNVTMAIEIEYENGHREWHTVKGSEVEDFCKTHIDGIETFFSDEDLCTRQEDENVRAFLNFCKWNCYHNPKFKGVGLWDTIEKAFGVEFEKRI